MTISGKSVNFMFGNLLSECVTLLVVACAVTFVVLQFLFILFAYSR